MTYRRSIAGGLSAADQAKLSATFAPIAHLDSGQHLPRWAPPKLVNPTIYTAGNTFLNITAGPNEDVLIFGRAGSACTANVQVVGGRNVIVVGGSYAKSVAGAQFRMNGVTGSVTFEGCDIDASGFNNDVFNACGVQSGTLTYPDIYLLKCRVYGVNGTTGSNHADGYQPQGPIRYLFADLCTIQSDYQGFFLPPQAAISGVFISRTNFKKNVNATNPITYPLWFNDGTQSPYPVILDEVYVELPAGQDLANDGVWPKVGTVGTAGVLDTLAIGAIDDGAGNVSWPAVMQIDGKVYAGKPPNGDFCPAGSVGIGYVSKGYQAAPAIVQQPKLGWTTTKTGAYTAKVGDSVKADTTGGTFAVTLEAPTNAGGTIRVKWAAGTAAPTIAAAAGRTLDSSWVAFAAVGDVVEFNDDGAIWQIVSAKITAPAGTASTVKRGRIQTVDPVAMKSTATAFSAANRTYYMRLPAGRARNGCTKFRIEVGTASGNICLALYANNGLEEELALPTGAPKATTGSVACPATGAATLTVSSFNVADGDWLAIACDNTTATFYMGVNVNDSAKYAGEVALQGSAFPCTTVSGAAVANFPFYVAVE